MRKGDWIQTVSGKQLWPLDPRPEEIDLYDIAHSLSNMCRFNGHCLRFYSVSEHSCYVSDLLDEKDKAWGLLHDASEAFLADIIRPVKPYLNNYISIEDKMMGVIAQRFGLETPMPKTVKIADNKMLSAEMQQLMASPPKDWNLTEPAAEVNILCLSPDDSRELFLQKARKLGLN